MKILTFSGWAQPYDSIQHLLPGSEAIDYASHDETSLFTYLSHTHADAELAIGWSLGGQLAVRAIANTVLNPKKLVLIAAPFQFVADQQFPHAMPKELFEIFYDNYKNDTARTVSKFTGLIAKGDSNQTHVESILRENTQGLDSERWRPWLYNLGHFSARALDFSHFPPTLIVHGEKDAIVKVEHARIYNQTIPASKIVVLPQVAHAPHLHDEEQFHTILHEFLHE